jgi:hypothetical protein
MLLRMEGTVALPGAMAYSLDRVATADSSVPLTTL